MNLNYLNMANPLGLSRLRNSSVLNCIAENVISETKGRQQEIFMAISQKVQDIDKKEEVQKKSKDEYKPMVGKEPASPKDIEKLTGQAISDLRNGVQRAAGNLEYYREKIKYMLSQKEEYQKRAAGEFTEEDYKQIELYKHTVSDGYDWESCQKEKAAKQVALLDNELEMYYKGIEDVADVHLSMAQGFSKIATLKYSNSDLIKEEYQKQFGDIADDLTTEKLGLQDLSSNPEEILEKLDAAIKALDNAGRKLEERYQNYTGKALEAYTGRKSSEEWLAEIKEEPIRSIINEEIKAGDKTPLFQIYLEDYDKKAVNLLDARG